MSISLLISSQWTMETGEYFHIVFLWVDNGFSAEGTLVYTGI